MQLPDNALRSAIYAALTTTPITYAAKQVKVYDSLAPDGAKAPYIVLDGQQSIPDDTKDTFGFSHTMTLRVIGIDTGQPKGRKAVEAITNLVLERIAPTTPGAIPLTVDGWHLWDVTLNGRDTVEYLSDKTVYQKILSVTYNLQQTT